MTPKYQFSQRVHVIFRWLSSALLFLVACSQGIPSFPTPSPSGTQTRLPTPMVRSSPVPTPRTASSPTPADRFGVTADKLKGVRIKLWHPWNGKDGETLASMAQEFNTTNPWGIILEPVAHGGLDQIVSLIESGWGTAEMPDIVTAYPYQMLEWDEEHGLPDLEDYVQDPLWGLSPSEQGDFFAGIWDSDLNGNKRLALPAERYAQVLIYNQSWGRELGFDKPPATSEEFMVQMCAAAQQMRQDDDVANDFMGGWIISTDYAAVLSWLYAFGSQIWINDDYLFNTAQVQNAFHYLRELLDKGCAWEASVEPAMTEFASRQGLAATLSVSDLSFQSKVFRRLGNRDEWTVIPYASASGQEAIAVYGSSFSILPSTPERQLAAWLWLKWFLQPSQQILWVSSRESLPLSKTVRQELISEMSTQWAAAAALLDQARTEPSMASWKTARWALSDAAVQLFRYYFSIEEVSDLTGLLDRTADQLHRKLNAYPATPVDKDAK